MERWDSRLGNHQVKVREGFVRVVLIRGCFLLLEVSWGPVLCLAVCSKASRSHLPESSETELDCPQDGKTKQLPWTKEAGDQMPGVPCELLDSQPF